MAKGNFDYLPGQAYQKLSNIQAQKVTINHMKIFVLTFIEKLR